METLSGSGAQLTTRSRSRKSSGTLGTTRGVVAAIGEVDGVEEDDGRGVELEPPGRLRILPTATAKFTCENMLTQPT